MDSVTTDDRPVEAAASAVEEIAGKKYMADTRGALVPVECVKDVDKLMDQTVRTIIAYADDLSAQIKRFKAHTHDDVAALKELLAEKYGASIGGRKGNLTLTSFDGCLKVTLQVQDHLTFGPEMQVAKKLVDDCISGWAEGTRPELRALIDHAFQVDKEGRINRAALYQLRRLDFEDEGWQRAMEALTDSMRVMGSSSYVRFHRRENAQAKWEPIPIDIAVL